MQRIVITIENGMLTGVFTDGDTKELIVDLVDYDNIKMSDDPDEHEEVQDVEAEIESGKLKSCW